MKKDILHKLFAGEFFPPDYIRCTSTEYLEACGKLDAATESFIRSLPDTDRKIFNKIDEMNNEAVALYNCEYFSEGFRLGAVTMLEILGYKQAAHK